MSHSTDAHMTFLEHLKELRSCIVQIAIGVGICSIASLIWASELFEFLTGPVRAQFHNVELIGTGPAEAFMVKLKTGFIIGLIVSAPYTFFQIWKFISPGMYQNEKKIAIPFVFASTLLFLLGVSFCFYVMFPFAFQFFADEFISIGVTPNIRIGEYLTFVVRLVFVFGIVFELPVVCFFLSRFGMLSHQWLIQQGRYAVVVIFIVAAILTPPDVITQLLLAFPLLILYALCIGIAYLVHPAQRAKSARAETLPVKTP